MLEHSFITQSTQLRTDERCLEFENWFFEHGRRVIEVLQEASAIEWADWADVLSVKFVDGTEILCTPFWDGMKGVPIDLLAEDGSTADSCDVDFTGTTEWVDVNDAESTIKRFQILLLLWKVEYDAWKKKCERA